MQATAKKPIGRLRQNTSSYLNTTQTYDIHPDHLDTPRLIADQAGNTVWRNDNTEPFGDSVPNDNPSGLGVFDFPLRFPGQYFDRETNLSHNYLRDYDPNTGRYLESDPIGLRGGPNTYAYVASNPLGRIDPRALYFGTDTLKGLLLDFFLGEAGKAASRAHDIGSGAKFLCKYGGYITDSYSTCTRECITAGTLNLVEGTGVYDVLKDCRDACLKELGKCKPPLACIPASGSES